MLLREKEKINILLGFEKLEDPRIGNRKLYKLEEILLLVLSSVLCGISCYSEMEDFGEAHIDWLKKYYKYDHGVPSHDTLGRVMSMIDPKKFNDCFSEWVSSFGDMVKKDIISIDGKKVAKVKNEKGGNDTIYVVSAWSTENGMVLGQEKVNEKSNEITAIPQLLNLLDLKNKVITIDAMGCQHEIAKQIVDKRGDYFLALKGNQKDLHESVKSFFEDEELFDESKDKSVYKTVSSEHGRIESRECKVVNDVVWLRSLHPHFRSISSIVKVESVREFKNSSKTTEKEARYYISSLSQTAQRGLDISRKHWQIENKLHWILDVQFSEDRSKISKDHSPQNMALIRRYAVNMIANYKKYHKLDKVSVKRIQNRLSWDKANLDNLFSRL